MDDSGLDGSLHRGGDITGAVSKPHLVATCWLGLFSLLSDPEKNIQKYCTEEWVWLSLMYVKINTRNNWSSRPSNLNVGCFPYNLMLGRGKGGLFYGGGEALWRTQFTSQSSVISYTHAVKCHSCHATEMLFVTSCLHLHHICNKVFKVEIHVWYFTLNNSSEPIRPKTLLIGTWHCPQATSSLIGCKGFSGH